MKAIKLSQGRVDQPSHRRSKTVIPYDHMTKEYILIAEDEGIVAIHLQSKLISLGYCVATVSSGEEALQSIRTKRPDLILMDIMLNGQIDGIETAAKIQQQFLPIPVVYLTAYADNDTLQRAKVTNPFGYILKPFEEGVLRSTIEMALYKYKATRDGSD
jgi:CheY-like chemotaxis protein